jgi:hypothetical protein
MDFPLGSLCYVHLYPGASYGHGGRSCAQFVYQNGFVVFGSGRRRGATRHHSRFKLARMWLEKCPHARTHARQDMQMSATRVFARFHNCIN